MIFLLTRILPIRRHLLTILSRRYETVGLYGRSLLDLEFIVEQSLRSSHLQADVKKPLPTRILYPKDFFPLANAEQQALYENFLQKLEAYLGVKRIEVNLAQLWADKPPSDSDAEGLKLQEYMKKVSFRRSDTVKISFTGIVLTFIKAPFWSLCFDFFQSFKTFRSTYYEKTGRVPFMEAASRLRW